MEKNKEIIFDIIVPIITIIFGLIVTAIFIKVTGKSPVQAYKLLIEGAFGKSFQDFLSLRLVGEGFLKGGILTLTGFLGI